MDTMRRGGGRMWRSVRMVAPTLCVVVVVTLVVGIIIVNNGGVFSGAAGHGGGKSAKIAATPTPPTLTQQRCGVGSNPACSTASKQWIALRSTSPADVLAAARQSALFSTNSDGQGDTPSLARLGDAQFVRALRGAGVNPSTVADYFDIPILNGTNAPVGVVMCEANATLTAISVAAIIQYAQPRATGSLARIGQSAAVAAVVAQHHTTLAAGAQAQLVYLPNITTALETGQITWVGGGASPYDPIWSILGADGQTHVVDDDGHVYYLNALPINTPAQ